LGLLFVSTPGAQVKRDGNTLIVELKGERKRIPVGAVEHLFLFGGVNITANAIRLLSSRGRFVFMLNRFAKPVSTVYPELIGSDSSVRVAQYLSFIKEEKRVAFVKELLRRKIENIAAVLNSLYRSRALKPDGVNEWKEGALTSLSKAQNLQALLGVDGSITRYMYSKFSSFNESPFYFDRREYYPPPDPVNALLSLSFTIFYSLLQPVILSQSFDPYLGFFHVKRGRHAALSSDLLELVRPFLAKFVFDALNDGFFYPDDFSSEKKGVFLKPNALKAFLKLYASEVIHNEELVNEPLNFLKWLKEELKGEVPDNLRHS
jgi:CRISPR-associated protein Cas1